MPHIKDRVRWISLGAVFLALANPMPAHAEVLRWKFTPGDTLRYRMEQKNVIDVRAPGHAVKTTVNQVTETTWAVKSVSEDGSARMEQTIDRIRIKIESPASKTFEYDTARDTKPGGLVGATLVPTLKAIVGGTFQYQMSGRGEVHDLKLPENLVWTLREAGKTAQGPSMFSEDSMKAMILEMSLILPEKDLARGESWTRRSKLAAPLSTEVRDKTYTYEGLDADSKAEKVSVSVKLAIDAPPDSRIATQVGDQRDTGTYLFDNKAGRVVKASRDQSIRVVYTVISPTTRTPQEVVESRESTSSMNLVETNRGVASK